MVVNMKPLTLWLWMTVFPACGAFFRCRPLYHYVTQWTRKYHIDRSHNIVHAMDVAKLAQSIAPFNMSTQRVMDVMVVSLLHDTIDRKYVNTTIQKPKIITLLREEMGYHDRDAQCLVRIMETMSHSATITNHSTFHEPTWLQKMEESTRETFHIVRQADLLASFDVERMLQYKYYRMFEHVPNRETRIQLAVEDTKTMFQVRLVPLLTIPNVFPMDKARRERDRLFHECSRMIGMLELMRHDLYSPQQFRYFRLLGDDVTWKELRELYHQWGLSSTGGFVTE